MVRRAGGPPALRTNLPKILSRASGGAAVRVAQTYGMVSIAQPICLFVGRESLRGSAHATTRARSRLRVDEKPDARIFRRCYVPPRSRERALTKAETQARILEEWFRLPESRRRYATDAVAFAYRLLRDQPELGGPKEIGHESIVDWLLPHLAEAKTG
jgi:hypothetical protein